MIESLFESFLRFAGRKQIVYCLKMEHQSLKTLQQRVVQFAGDAGSFSQALFESQRDLAFGQRAHSGHHSGNHQAVIKKATVATIARGFFVPEAETARRK